MPNSVMTANWADYQIQAATNAGAKLVLQPRTNMNAWTGGVTAVPNMRVRANPAFFDAYTGDTMRWGIAPCEGTIVGTCDDNSELKVLWDDGSIGVNIKAGKQNDYWLITARSCV